MKSKKKTKKPKARIKVAPPSKKHKTKKAYNRKNSTQIIEDMVTIAKERERATNKYTGSKFEDFMKEASKNHGFVMEKCECAPEKGCLDPIEFTTHQVHNGVELTNKPIQIHNESKITWFSQLLKAFFGSKKS